MSGRAPIFYSIRMDSVKRELVRIKRQILLLDYELPQLNGPDGISGLMKLSPEAKIIILTSLYLMKSNGIYLKPVLGVLQK